MCTIVLIRNTLANYPLAVTANRDEILDRPSESPAFSSNSIFAPRDLQRGGTWIGINTHGVFAGLTNRQGVISKPGKTSRGELPHLALQQSTAKNAFEAICRKFQNGKDFNGFFLVIADAQQAYLFGGDGLHLTHRQVTENVLAVTNRGVGTVGDAGLPETPRRVSNIIGLWPRLQKQLKDIPANPRLHKKQQDAHAKELSRLLHIHDEDRHGTCVNEIQKGYGTKSSSIIFLDKANGEWIYWHREREGEKHICGYAFTQYFVRIDE